MAGYSLVERACDSVPKYVSHTIVTTDCATSGRIAKEYGFEVVWRSAILAGHNISGMSVWQHALSASTDDNHMTFDCSILLQPSTPTRTQSDISHCIDAVIDDAWDSACTVSLVPDRFAPHKQVDVRAGKLQIVERRHSASYTRDGACFAGNAAGVFGDFYANCAAIQSKGAQVNIDEPLDLEIARMLLE